MPSQKKEWYHFKQRGEQEDLVHLHSFACFYSFYCVYGLLRRVIASSVCHCSCSSWENIKGVVNSFQNVDILICVRNVCQRMEIGVYSL